MLDEQKEISAIERIKGIKNIEKIVAILKCQKFGTKEFLRSEKLWNSSQQLEKFENFLFPRGCYATRNAHRAIDAVKRENVSRKRREFSVAEGNSTRTLAARIFRVALETHEIINEPFRRSRLCTTSDKRSGESRGILTRTPFNRRFSFETGRRFWSVEVITSAPRARDSDQLA